MTDRIPNDLIHASSPYLQQHAYNPVEWNEWSEVAWERARKEDKLVIVSVGYAACHWCHVMEHECFESEETAEIMNQHFICIKVDREERPDVDAVYMDACQLITQRGGWPLNAFCLPDGRPIHAGTYFPKKQWEELLLKLAYFYRTKKEEAEIYAQKLTAGVKTLDNAAWNSDKPTEDEQLVTTLIEKWKTLFDPVLGGYNWAPKFPMPSNYSCLLHLYSHTCDLAIRHQVENTLKKMALGGIYDQVGGGFSRYAVDDQWKVPHFEKMLYDNAQLVSLYSKVHRISPLPLYKKVVEETIEFLQRELQHPNGLFYSALDADSEGIEGKFYVLTSLEIDQILGEDSVLFKDYFCIDSDALWEHGNNVLMSKESMQDYAFQNNHNSDNFIQYIKRCRSLLYTYRSSKVRPGLDDKSICSWNALMIAAYCDAYQSFGNEDHKTQAIKLTETMFDLFFSDQVLHRIWKDDKFSIPAFAEDYATFSDALLKLYEITFDEKYVYKAKELIDICISNFYDLESSYFKMKSKFDTPLYTTKVDITDDVIPSANSILGHVLYRLGFILSITAFVEIADKMIDGVKGKFASYPTGYSNWVELYLLKRYGLFQVIYTQTPDREWRNSLQGYFIPNAIFLLQGELPLTTGKEGSDFNVYICKDQVCYTPTANLEGLVSKIFEIQN